MDKIEKEMRQALNLEYQRLKVPEQGSLEKDYFTVKEVAIHLNLSEYIVRKLIKSKQLAALTIRRRIRVERLELARFKVAQRFLQGSAEGYRKPKGQ